MSFEKLEVRRREVVIVEFGKGYDGAGLLSSIKESRIYDGIDWSKQNIQDRSRTTAELLTFEINRSAYFEEVIKSVRHQFPLLKRSPAELGLCLLKRFPRRSWEPPWVLSHEPISNPKKQFPHISVLSGSRLSGARTEGGSQFHKDCLFVFVGSWE